MIIGLLGATDGAFIIYKAKRADADAVIDMSGRDQPDKKINLKRNRETLCWDFDKEFDGDFKPKSETILEAIGEIVNEKSPEWKGTSTELLTILALDMQPNALSAKLNINAGRLYAEYYV